jgi:hypothetical protein
MSLYCVQENLTESLMSETCHWNNFNVYHHSSIINNIINKMIISNDIIDKIHITNTIIVNMSIVFICLIYLLSVISSIFRKLSN